MVTGAHRYFWSSCWPARTSRTSRIRAYNRKASSQSHQSRLPIGGRSHLKGPKDEPLCEDTIYESWYKVVQRNPDRQALVSRSEHSRNGPLRWTFAQMDEEINRVARGLEGIGIGPGDRVAVYLGNTSQHATLQFATARIGAILTSVNPSYRIPELVAALNVVDCKALFVSPQVRTTDNISALLAALPSLSSSNSKELRDPAVPALRSVVAINNVDQNRFDDILSRVPALMDFTELQHMGSVPQKHYDVQNKEIANMQFTSGTTGAPKAVALTHRNLINNGFHIGDNMRLTERDVLCNTPPLFHCFGLVLGNLAAWTHSSCVVYPNDTFDPMMTLQAVTDEGCTALHGVPTMFLAMFEKMKTGNLSMDFSRLRTGIAAGSSVPASLMSRLVNELNLSELTIAYGMTESSPVSFQSTPEDPLDKRVETVGRILPHVEAMVCAKDRPLEPLPVNQAGELYVSGYNVMHSYWAAEDETAKVLSQDAHGKTWLATGDCGSIAALHMLRSHANESLSVVTCDEEGYVAVRGRLKDVIIKGGENLFPILIESHCLKHQGIGDASVVAVRDEFYGEVVGVFVQRASNAAGRELQANDVREHIRSYSLQSAPHYVWFLGDEQVRSEFPKTASGKIQKMVLRKETDMLVSMNLGFVGSTKR